MIKQDNSKNTGRPKRPPRTWGRVLKNRQIKGAVQRKYRNWIRKLYHTQGPGTPFTLREMMAECGTNYESRRDYSKANAFIMKMRKDFAEVMKTFFAPNGDYEKHKASGKTDSAIFEELVNAAVSFDIYPVWADPYDEHRYKLFDMASFAYLVERRATAMSKEVEHKAPVMALIFSKLPELQQFYTRPQLKGDGVLLELPPGVDCTICHQFFGTQAEFIDHYNRNHQNKGGNIGIVIPPESIAKLCPLCKVKLKPREKGDWICPECKQKFDIDQSEPSQEEE